MPDARVHSVVHQFLPFHLLTPPGLRAGGRPGMLKKTARPTAGKSPARPIALHPQAGVGRATNLCRARRKGLAAGIVLWHEKR